MERRLVEENKVRASKVVLIPFKKSKDITITPMLTESGIDIVDMVASYSTTDAYKMNNFLPFLPEAPTNTVPMAVRGLRM